jgi:hypothetical protein
LKDWQIQLAFWGGLLWLGAFSITDYAKSHQYHELSSVIAGYVMGFVTAFSGHLLWEIICGRGKKFLDSHPVSRILSIIPLISLIAFGLIGFYGEIFGNTPWYYNISFFVAGFIVNNALIPVINHFDNRNKRQYPAK